VTVHRREEANEPMTKPTTGTMIQLAETDTIMTLHGPGVVDLIMGIPTSPQLVETHEVNQGILPREIPGGEPNALLTSSRPLAGSNDNRPDGLLHQVRPRRPLVLPSQVFLLCAKIRPPSAALSRIVQGEGEPRSPMKGSPVIVDVLSMIIQSGRGQCAIIGRHIMPTPGR